MTAEPAAPESSQLQWMRRLIAGTAKPPPIAAFLGLELLEAEAGRAVFALAVDERMANPMGTLHGGILVDLGDAAMGFGMASTLADGESFTTLELKANYFKPVRRGRLVATARMVRRTRQTGYLECDVVDEGGSLVARLASTCMVLRGADAVGR